MTNMKAAYMYRFFGLLIVFHFSLLCGYGQAVTGNKYSYVSLDVSGFKVLSKLVDGEDIGSKWADKDLKDIPWNGPNNYFWWTADRDGSLVMTVDCGSDSHIPYYVFGIGEVATPAERPKGIIIEQSKDGVSDWEKLTEQELSRSENITSNYTQEVILPTPITERYIRVTFEQDEDKHLAFNYFQISTLPQIRHKHAKWYELREGVDEASKLQDTFSDTNPMVKPADNPFISEYEEAIQSAHIYLDTIYMHRGTSIELTLPDYYKKDNNNPIRTYQRWYSFRRDKTFETNHTKPDDVYDLLTPSSGTVMRFANGYVGNPVVGGNGSNNYLDGNSAMKMSFYMPTKAEFADWFPNVSGFDDIWFIVACDVSGYNDYTETYIKDGSYNSVFFDGTNIECWEPTLTHRVLFYISAVDGRGGKDDPNWDSGHGRLALTGYYHEESTEYTYTDTDKFMEDYTIIRPYYRLNNKQNYKDDKTEITVFSDALALSKDARAYAIPDASSDKDELDVTIIENSAGIKLWNTKVSGTSRLIQFDYPTTSNNILSVNGESATIIVTKTVNKKTYNIARYKLIFEKDVTLLPQSVINGLDDGKYDNNNTWKSYKTRTPKYLKENYQLVTSITWDYDTNISENTNGYYRYPMAWDYSSYGFYDGSSPTEFKGGGYNNNREKLYPEWGHYGITKAYVENIWNNSSSGVTVNEPEGDDYHLYIDGSDRPGVIAMLPFKDNLCAGAEIFVSAWVKEAGSSKDIAGSGMLFTIMGVTENGEKIPLCRYGTGQFLRTDYYDKSFPGCGENTNEWLHVYFSFINRSEIQYDSYMLQIDNNSVSTDGADMYLDAVRIFVAQPTAVVKQKQAACVDDPTLMNIKLDWERLLSRTGGSHIDGNDDIGAVDFCFVDKIKYEEELARLLKENESDAVKKALEAAVMKIGQDEQYTFAQLHYYINYDENKVYGTNGTLAKDNIDEDNQRGFFYRHTDENGIKSLSVDFYSTLSVGRPYWILLLLTNTSGKVPSVSDFAMDFDKVCSIKTEFYIEAQNQITINGDIVNPVLDGYCKGTSLNFAVKMRYSTGKVDEDGVEQYEYLEGGYYDWFFGSEDEFTKKVENYDFSVNEALSKFRNAYPDAEKLPDGYDGTKSADFTADMYDVLEKKIDAKVLFLCFKSQNIELTPPGLQLVIRPVPGKITVPDNTLCCWEYTPLSLRVTGGSPELKAGYTGMAYPQDENGKEYNPNMRIGLEQIKKAVDKDNSLICNLCLATPAFESSSATHMGRVVDSENLIYLMETDDPDMNDYIDKSASPKYAFPIGWIDFLRAYRNDRPYEGESYMTFHFDLKGELATTDGFIFKPREGYYYTFTVYFEEKIREDNGESISAGNSCIGEFNLKMDVVPEYVIWNGGATDNWNNDYNWSRVNSAERINKPENSYVAYTEQSFVPMQFSKVIIPKEKKVELYVAGYDQSSASGWNWKHDRPSYIGEPTENIQFDLMVVEHRAEDSYPGRLVTDRYRAYWIDQIHFEPGAQMRGAEYLIYEKAWVDYELEANKWIPLTSPLQGTVAGDFYTDMTTARERGEYFQPIEFSSSNSRLSPYVFQRDWDAKSAQLMKVDGTESNVAIKGNWSGVYNDVDEWETYQPGCGFSLKVTQLPTGATDGKALFRLPKADEKYYYYYDDKTDDVPSISKDVSGNRTSNHGKLISDGLFNRVAYHYESSKGEDIKIKLEAAADGNYYMIGNPFMTNLDVNKFFEGNKDVLQQKYWMGDGSGAAAGTTEDGWVTTKGTVTDIAPLTAFFVQKVDGLSDNVTEINLSADMQAKFPEATENAGSGAKPGVLYMTATASDGWTSNAAVVYDDNASAGYGDERDVIMFINPANEGMPQVYTAGGGYALSINTVPSGSRIPVGVCGSSREDVMLRFGGVGTCGDVRLYDSRERSETALYDGYELTVTANDDGRYYIVGGSASGISSPVDVEHGISIYSVRRGEITVACDAADIVSVVVYGADGGTRASAVGGSRVVNVPVASGVAYIVRATAADGTSRTAKVLVR